MFQGWSVLSNFVDVLDDFTCLCLSNHVLALLDGAVSNSLPTTNAVSLTNLNPYTLTYRVNHLPWLEGMVTWWPLDVDGSDIFGGLNGLLLGDVAFSTGSATNLFSDDFTGPGLNPMWQAALPNAGTGARRDARRNLCRRPQLHLRHAWHQHHLAAVQHPQPQQRRGWSSATTFNGAGLPLRGALQHAQPGRRRQHRAGLSKSGFWMRPIPTVRRRLCPSAGTRHASGAAGGQQY